MNRKTGMYASLLNLFSVLVFGCSMLFKNGAELSFFSSMFIAFSFVAMTCAFSYYCSERKKAAAYCATAFGAMYALCNLLVYYTQLTTVRNSSLSEQARELLDFNQFGLLFNWDMLGYCLMAVSTFFIGLSLSSANKCDKWLKRLLITHGVFAVTCFLCPMLGIFHPGMSGGNATGIAVLSFWCLYFTPISVLSFLYFKRIPLGASTRIEEVDHSALM